ncbi:MAG: GWxTD domain-containing protein, partial [Candidatus Aegiribacteria sp.]|nr:GWxTD domain-containing protein [Candidatus Aegiribacteria sp.]MBD3294991.1 GWxTD domain-containing protein [Candidatus Fermentibacteria bacterium]
LRKGAVLVFPAADGSYTLPEEHMAYYYLEVYDMGGETVQVQARLETASGETIFARPWATINVPEGAQAVSLIDSLDLRTVRNSGLHSVVFDLVQQEDTSEVRKDLMVARILEGDSDISDLTVTSEEVPYPDEFRLILSQSELSVFDSLDDEAKSRFYASYWQNAPEQRELFEQRCEDSRRYASSIREGWQTDRGRVYVIYGPPDDIESVSFQGEQVPYEIWYYYGGANEQFVFADLSGFGDYEQVFSTVEGEVSYSNWQDMISTISEGGG